jgi:hypothetical protein
VSSEPVTKQDLADAVQQIDENFSRELADAVQQVTDKLAEAIRDSQTEVLRAFYDWSRPVDARLRHADDLVQRMGGWKSGLPISNAENCLRLIERVRDHTKRATGVNSRTTGFYVGRRRALPFSEIFLCVAH